MHQSFKGKRVSFAVRLALHLAIIATTLTANADDRADWVSAGFGSPAISELVVDDNSEGHLCNHSVPIDVILVRGTGWSEALARAQWKRAAKLYRKYGIRLWPVRLIQVDCPPSVKRGHFDFGLVGECARFGERIPGTTDRISVILVTTLDIGFGGYAGTESTEQGALLNKIWIALKTTTDEWRRERPYSVEAHELGHILTGCAHWYPLLQTDLPDDPPPKIICSDDPGNLMHYNPKIAGDALTGAQLTQMRSSRFVREN